MPELFLDTALLPQGWRSDVRLRCTEDGTITAIESGASCGPGAVHLRGAALPGLPSLHSHAHQRAIAGAGERSGAGEDSFWSWRQAMYRALDRMDPDLFEAVATQLYVEMLKAGYTRVAEFHYLHHGPDGRAYADRAEMAHRVVAAARAAGIGLTLLPVLYAAGGFGDAAPNPGQRRFLHDADGFGRLMQALRRDYADDPSIVLGIAPHSLRAVPAPVLAEALADAPVGPVHIHVAEQIREVEECVAHTGRRPVEWLLDACPVDARWCLVHATHMLPAETRAFAASGAVAGLCPTTEANLGDGLFPAEAFRAAGGCFGIGSDSNASVSPVEELRWLEYGVRLVTRRRTVLAGGPSRSTGRALFDAALEGGAQACGFEAGLRAGARADLVVLDDQHPLLAGRHGDALLDGWIFAGNVPLVRHVAVAGRVVVHDGRHPSEADASQRFVAAMRVLAG